MEHQKGQRQVEGVVLEGEAGRVGLRSRCAIAIAPETTSDVENHDRVVIGRGEMEFRETIEDGARHRAASGSDFERRPVRLLVTKRPRPPALAFYCPACAAREFG